MVCEVCPTSGGDFVGHQVQQLVHQRDELQQHLRDSQLQVQISKAVLLDVVKPIDGRESQKWQIFFLVSAGPLPMVLIHASCAGTIAASQGEFEDDLSHPTQSGHTLMQLVSEFTTLHVALKVRMIEHDFSVPSLRCLNYTGFCICECSWGNTKTG